MVLSHFVPAARGIARALYCLLLLFGAAHSASAAPTVAITAPTAGKNFGAPVTITITANATPSPNTITQVDFFRGGTTLIGTATGATTPHSFPWPNVAVGNYSLTARATDSTGAMTTSAPVAITVKANVTPTVAMTAPAADASYTAGATVTLSATASDTDGTISKVEFLRSTTVIGTVTAPPYTFDWTNVPAGSYSLTAKATDNSNGTKSSTPARAITVYAPPTVSISAPVNNRTYAAPANVTINATAAAATGAAISRVEFYAGATKLGQDTTASYSFVWSNAPPGAHALTAVAIDNKGGTKTSAPINITVTGPPPPVVSIYEPTNGANFLPGSDITIGADAATGTGGMPQSVEFLRNGISLGAPVTTEPYIFTWSAVPAGNYILTAKVKDNVQQTTTSAEVAITVSVPKAKPTVSFTSPVSGTVYQSPATISMTAIAAAAEPGTTLTSLEIFDGTTRLAQSSTSPLSFVWPNRPTGGYVLTAKATDSLGTVGVALLYAVVDGTDSCTTTPPLASVEPSRHLAALENAPLTFEANAGQTHRDVLFQLRGQGYQLFLTGNESVLALQSGSPTEKNVALRMKFVGANDTPHVRGVDAVERKSNYLVGRDPRNWRTNVPHYAKVRYESVYPGVDKVFYANDGKLEYDLVVAPGASPHAIRFALEGADRISLNDEGDLLLETRLGTLVQRKPVAFQDIDGQRRPVNAKYRLLAANQVAFDLGRYDPDHTLVIDPVLVYSTFVTGSNASLSKGISISRCGEAFIAGYTVAADFPTTPDAFDTSSVPGTRMGFVAKLNQAGTGLLYSTFITGTTWDWGDGFPQPQSTEVSGLGLDGTGHVYVTGVTYSTDFPVTPGSYLTTPGGSGNNAFVAKLTTDGSGLVYSTYLEAQDSLAAFTVDASGNAYALGLYVLWKLNPSGSAAVYQYPIYPLTGMGIAADADGNAYVTGYTTSNAMSVTPGVFQSTRPGTSQSFSSGFVSKINPSGTALVYSTYLGTTGETNPTSIAVDSLGNAYVTGFSDGKLVPNFVGTGPIFNLDGNQASITWAFVAKVRPNGTNLDYFTRIGGLYCNAGTPFCFGATTGARSIAVDSASNAWIAGETTSNRFPFVKPLYTSFGTVTTGPFVMKLAASGATQLFSTLLNGQTEGTGSGVTAGGTEIRGIQVDSVGSAYVSGWTDRLDFPTTAGAFQRTIPSGITPNAFVTKINETKDTTTTLAVTPSTGAVGVTSTLTATIAGNSPTGTVTFKDGGTVLGTGTVSGTTAQFGTNQLPAGARSLVAEYAGDSRNNPSSSAALPYNVSNPGTFPTVSLSGLADGSSVQTNSGNLYVNGWLTINANAATGNHLTRATVTFQGSTWWWNLNSASFTGTWDIPSIGVGIYSVFAGAIDSNGNTTYSSPIRFVVNPAGATPPAVSIGTPSNGASFTVGSAIALSATASAAGAATITNVAFYAGSTPIASISVAPYSGSWSGAEAGSYSVVAVATDSNNARTISAPVTITVTSPPPPTVSIVAPAGGSSFTTPVTINITADAAAASGAAIQKVEFYSDGALIGTSTASPYTFGWSNPTGGPHSLTAKATDTRGVTKLSSPVSITVTTPPPPIVNITSPANGSTFPAPAEVSVTTSASGQTGATITSLQIYAGSKLIGIGPAITWDVLMPGSYMLTARATDNRGGITVSAPVNVTISGDATENITFLHNDLAGNAIVGTDILGGVKWKENYKPFGQRVMFDSQASSNRQWFGGKPQDNESGMLYFGARYYDPVVGRFMGVDPVGFDEDNLQSFNRYAFGNSNPYRYTDPDGRVVETVLDIISLGLSIAAFKEDPSLWNGLGLAWDAAATVVPFVPGGFGIVKSAAKAADAASSLPAMKGMGAAEREKALTEAGFAQTKVGKSSAKNEEWTHADGSEVKVHPYGNKDLTPHKSANNAHLHKNNSDGKKLTDRGTVSGDESQTHIGLPNPKDLPQVRDRPHGS